MEFRRKKEPKVNVMSEETWRRMEPLIRAEGRFLRLVEIMGLGEFSPVQGTQFVDYNYRRGNLLKQFSLVDKSLIVGVDEVVVPEIGFSKRLGSLLVEGGFT
jgi:acetoacetate decarboxylase